MIKLLRRVATAAVLLFVLFVESPDTARGQGIGINRGRQGRRVGTVTLPTPAFNPNAGILNSPGAHKHATTKGARRRSTRRGVKRQAVRRRARRRGLSRK